MAFYRIIFHLGEIVCRSKVAQNWICSLRILSMRAGRGEIRQSRRETDSHISSTELGDTPSNIIQHKPHSGKQLSISQGQWRLTYPYILSPDTWQLRRRCTKSFLLASNIRICIVQMYLIVFSKTRVHIFVFPVTQWLGKFHRLCKN